ncbi:hypothetical protein Tco_0986128 [Tanacetum coccineum]
MVKAKFRGMMEKGIEDMTISEYMEYEAEMKRQSWRNARSYFPTKYENTNINSFHHDKSRVLDYPHHSNNSKINAYYDLPPLLHYSIYRHVLCFYVLQEMLNLRNSNQDPLVDLYHLEGSDKGDNKIDSLTKEPLDTLLIGDEVISTTPERESEVTSVCDDLEYDIPVNTPLPTTDVRDEVFDINSPLGEQVLDFLKENVDVAGLPRHLVKQLFSHLLKNPSVTKGMSDEPLGDDTKPRSFDVTFSNPLFNFNDDFTLCKDNLFFDEEFEDISSLDLPELTLVIDEPTLLDTLPLPCTDVLVDAIVDTDLPLGDPLDTLSTGDREIDFNPSRDNEELERLLADDLVLVPRVFDEPLGNFDSMSRSSETSDLFEELIAEFGLDDLIPTKIDDRYHDSEGDILYFEQLLNKDTSFDVSSALLPT